MRLISIISKKTISVAIIVWCFVILPQAFAEKISLVSTNWPPYAGTTLPEQGIAIHIVKSVFERAGYQSDVKIEQWNRALQGSKIGVYDVVATIYRNETRQNDLLFSEPYLINEVKFIVRKDSEIKYNSLTDLNGLLIGVLNDYAYEAKFDKSQQIIKIPANRLTQNLLVPQHISLDQFETLF